MSMSGKSNHCRISIADDSSAFRDAVRRLLESEASFRVVGSACDGVEAVQMVRELQPDVLLLDLAMRGRDGIEALRDLASSRSSTRTIVLTGAIDKFELVQALQLGAHGVVLKDSATEVLVEAIRGVMSGHYWVAREMVGGLIEALRTVVSSTDSTSKKNYGLTQRELEIVETVVAGYPNKDIASRFAISEQTVKHHLSNIFVKLGVSSRLEAAMFALHHGLVKGQ